MAEIEVSYITNNTSIQKMSCESLSHISHITWRRSKSHISSVRRISGNEDDAQPPEKNGRLALGNTSVDFRNKSCTSRRICCLLPRPGSRRGRGCSLPEIWTSSFGEHICRLQEQILHFQKDVLSVVSQGRRARVMDPVDRFKIAFKGDLHF